MKTSAWKPTALDKGALPALDFTVMTLPVRLYSAVAPSTGSLPLIGALQVMLDCLRNRVVASIETEDGELLLASSDTGQFTAYKEGLTVALKIMDSVRADEYRRGYGEALDWVRESQRLAELRQAEQQQAQQFESAETEQDTDYVPEAAPQDRHVLAPAHEPRAPAPRQTPAQGQAPRHDQGPRQNSQRAKKRDDALGDLLRPKSSN